MRADSAALARSCEGRRAISFGKPANFLGITDGSKIFFINAGHVSRAKIGESV